MAKSAATLSMRPVETARGPRTKTVEVSIVIPCRNESGRIADVVREAREALAANGYVGEVVVCDNGSSDDSAAAAAAEGARVVRQPIRGYGAACVRGIEAACGDFVVLVDGDGTYDISVLPRFIEPLKSGYDLVLGTRRNGEIRPGAMRRRHRHFFEPLQTQLARRFLPFAVSDVRCGMRSATRDALREMNLGSAGMEFATEMLLAAARTGLTTVEVPVSLRPRGDRRSRRSSEDGWRVARFLLLLSPTRLFVTPGLALLFLGLALQLALLPGPIPLGAYNLDFHFLFVGSASAILGLQLILLGVYAKTYALVHNAGPYDRWILRFNLLYTLERGIAAGGVLFVIGLAINIGILFFWISGGAGVIFAVRPAMLALTLMVLGAELVFASFFLTLLRAQEFGRA